MGSAYDEAVFHRGLAFARVVAVLFLLGAVLDAAALLQTLAMVYEQSASVICAELAFAGAAALKVLVGSRVYDGSTAASVLGVVVAVVDGLFAAGWFVFLLVWGGVFAVLPALVAAGSLFAALAGVVMIPVSRTVTEQRRLLLDGL